MDHAWSDCRPSASEAASTRSCSRIVPGVRVTSMRLFSRGRHSQSSALGEIQIEATALTVSVRGKSWMLIMMSQLLEEFGSALVRGPLNITDLRNRLAYFGMEVAVRSAKSTWGIWDFRLSTLEYTGT